MSSLRIGLFTECYRPIQNGIVTSVDVLAEALRAAGHDVVVVTPSMPGYDESSDDVVRVPSLPLPTRTAYRLTIPLVASERLAQLSIVHTHSPFVTGWMGARIAKRYNLPLVFTYHTRLEEYAHYVPFDARATRSAATHLTRSYANAAGAVVVPTPAMETRLRELGVRSRIEVVPSGIDVSHFAAGRRSEELRARLGVPPGGKMLLSVGRLGREKNLELALGAFALLEDSSVRFVIVGDGVHRESLERAARRIGVAERTTFAGELARGSLPDVYRSADAFLFTSTSETQGLVLAEALAAGVPLIAVDTPETRDVLDGVGTLAPPQPRPIATALSAVLSGRRPSSGAAQEAAARRFDGSLAGARILELYASLLEPERVPAMIPA